MTLIVCRYKGDAMLLVINLTLILSVVAIVSFQYTIDSLANYYFMIEKIGLDVVNTDAQED